MRWKLLRRRLSVSAPRMIVRSHLPWPLRWAALAVMLGFSAAIALWAFELGRELAGLDREEKAELARVSAELTSLQQRYASAQQLADTADSLLKTERAAQERLAQLETAMEELARVTTAHVLAVVNVCGNKFTTPHCPAAGLVGLQTLKPRAWWVEKFAKHGLSLHPVSSVFERRPCDADGKAARTQPRTTTVDDGWSIADVRRLCDCVAVCDCV